MASIYDNSVLAVCQIRSYVNPFSYKTHVKSALEVIYSGSLLVYAQI